MTRVLIDAIVANGDGSDPVPHLRPSLYTQYIMQTGPLGCTRPHASPARALRVGPAGPECTPDQIHTPEEWKQV